MTAPCCDRLRQLPGGPICPLHGIPKAARKVRQPRQRAPARDYHAPKLRPEHVDQMLDGLVSTLKLINERIAA